MPIVPPAISFGDMKIPAKISALAVPVLVVALAGCGEESPPGDSAESPAESTAATEATEASGDDVCATLTELGSHATVMSGGMMADATETAASAAAARELLESTEPPAEIADAWADVTAFYAAVDDAFAAADIEEGQTTAEVLGEVSADITDTAEPALEGLEDIQVYTEEHCGGSAPAAEASGACGMLTDTDLAQVFGEAIPEPEDGSFGPQAQECTWGGAGGPVVSVMYQTRADFEANFLESSAEPRDTVEGLENGQLHKGIFGIGSFDTRGSSVYFTIGDWGGVVGVRSGEDDNFAHDDPIAVGLAFRVVEQLS